jgi:hypothetical protein
MILNYRLKISKNFSFSAFLQNINVADTLKIIFDDVDDHFISKLRKNLSALYECPFMFIPKL